MRWALVAAALAGVVLWLGDGGRPAGAVVATEAAPPPPESAPMPESAPPQPSEPDPPQAERDARSPERPPSRGRRGSRSSERAPMRERRGLRLLLHVPGRQRVVARRRFVVYVSCDPPCRIVARAAVSGGPRGPQSQTLRVRQLPAGQRTRLVLQLRARLLRAIRRGLRERGRSSLELRVVGLRQDGRRTVLERIIRFRLE